VNWKAHNCADLMEQPTLFYATVIIPAVIVRFTLFRLATVLLRTHRLGMIAGDRRAACLFHERAVFPIRDSPTLALTGHSAGCQRAMQ
jgi:hypothetical protein